METKHTPQPWYVGDGSPESNYEGPDCVITLRNGARTTLVKVNHYFGEESRANACLIAAAPDLLEACKLSAEQFCSMCCPSQWKTDDYPDGPPHTDACKKIRAAIAKAEKQTEVSK